MVNLETILSWFQTGDYPTQEEFEQTFSSFRHKDTKIPITEVDGLESSLNSKLSVDDLPSIDETLASVINRDNYCPKSIYFVEGDEEYTSLGINPNTYSFFWGDMKRSHTGLTNISMGYYSMSNLTTGQSNSAYSVGALFKLTSGSNNTAFGQASLYNLTTGYSNSVFGQGGLYNLTIGLKNTALGTNAGYGLTTGSLNTIIGYKANNSVNFGDKNIFIGANSAQGVTGSNNIMIGVGAGVNGGALSNKLIIHSNHTLNGYNNTSEGIYSNPSLSNLNNALITGDFADRWARVNGYFIIGSPASDVNNITLNPSTGVTAAQFYTPIDDNSFIQKKYVDNAVTEASQKEKGIINSSEFIQNGNALLGDFKYEHLSGSDFITVRFNINGTLQRGSYIQIQLPFGVGNQNLRKFANHYSPDVFINIFSYDKIIGISNNSLDDIHINFQECMIFPYGAEAAPV